MATCGPRPKPSLIPGSNPRKRRIGWIGALREAADVLRVDPELLGLDRRAKDPVHDLEPLIVAEAHDRSDRLLRNAIGKDDVVVRIAQHRARRRESGAVLADDIAASAGECAHRRAEILHHDRLERDVIASCEVGEVELRRRPLLHADRRAIRAARLGRPSTPSARENPDRRRSRSGRSESCVGARDCS